MYSDFVAPTLISLAIVFFVVVLAFGLKKKSLPEPVRVANWARSNGLHLVIAEKRYLFKGPFMFHRGVGPVYRIVVTDGDGKGRFGWLHLRAPLFGQDWEEISWTREEHLA